MTYVVQQKGGAVGSIEAVSPGIRIANACVSYIIYIGKTIWPVNLAVYYPHPGLWPVWQALGAVLLLIAVTIPVIRTAKRLPYLTVGWLWFTGTLVPVIGIVQVGRQAMADRYTYIPLIGLFVMAAWGIPELLKKWRPTRHPQRGAFCVVGIGPSMLFSLLHGHRSGTGAITLRCMITALKLQALVMLSIPTGVSPMASLAIIGRRFQILTRPSKSILNMLRHINNRGLAYFNTRRLQGSRFQILTYPSKSILKMLLPIITEVTLIANSADYRQAISDFDRSIQINSEYAGVYNNRGNVYGRIGDYRKAISDFDRAIQINPKYAIAYNNRSIAYGQLGDYRRSIEDMQKAARLGNEDAKNSLRSLGIKW